MDEQRYKAALQVSYEIDVSQDYGRRLITNLVDERARSEPNKLYASILYSGETTESLVDISYQRLSNAVNRASWWLFESMGQAGSPVVFAYMGPNDLCYPILLMAAMKCGYQMMMPSPRNSIDYQKELFLQAGCQTLYCTMSMMTKHLPLVEELDLFGDTAPDLWELLDPALVRPFPCSQTFEEVRRMPFMILHTSGSTGPPKPITFTYECTTAEDTHRFLPDPEHRLWWRLFANKRYLTGMPCFHSAGIWFALFLPVYFDSVIVLGLGNRPITSSAAISIFQKDTTINGAILPPSVLTDMSRIENIAEALKGVSFLAYGGGPLPPQAGDALSSLVILHNFIGFTEASAPPRYVMTEPEDWNYFQFHQASGFRPEHLHDDFYRLVFHRQTGYESCQSVFKLFPELEQYAPGDVLTPHPSKPDLWTHKGRTDDLIVLNTGEKFNPVPMELHLTACPHVKDVLVVGEGHTFAILLVEMNLIAEATAETGRVSGGELLSLLWPYVQTANKTVATHARITRDHIYILPQTKSFLRSPKGTVQRKLTIANLGDELGNFSSLAGGNKIRGEGGDHLMQHETRSANSQTSEPEQLFSDSDTSVSDAPSVVKEIEAQDTPVIKSDLLLPRVRDAVQSTFDQPANIGDDTDLLDLGMDSVQALRLSNELQRLVVDWPMDHSVALEKIYTNPTVRGLVGVLESPLLVKESVLPLSKPVSEGDNANAEIADEAQPLTDSALKADSKVIEELIQKYTDDLVAPTSHPKQNWTIVVTGASGSIGRQIVKTLVTSSAVAKVYCFDRRAGDVMGDASQVEEHVVVDLSKANLGIKPQQYTEIQRDVDIIIHAAWMLDFLKPLKSFESPHLAGVRHLIDLALGGGRQTRMVFLSSIASVLGCTVPDVPVAEDILDSPGLTWQNGYSQSKYIAERMLQQASRAAGLPVTILRLGQVSGPTPAAAGKWSISDWLPQIILTSQSLGAVPLTLGAADAIDWIPVDKVVDILLDITRHDMQASDSFQLYNIANPRVTSWGSLLPAVCHRLQDEDRKVKLVTFDQWLVLLRSKLQERSARVADFPAIRLLGWLGRLASATPLPTLALQKALMVSPTLSKLQAIDGEIMERWMQDWRL